MPERSIMSTEYRDHIKNYRRGGYDRPMTDMNRNVTAHEFARDNDLLLRRISNQLASMIQLMEPPKALIVTERDKSIMKSMDGLCEALNRNDKTDNRNCENWG